MIRSPTDLDSFVRDKRDADQPFGDVVGGEIIRSPWFGGVPEAETDASLDETKIEFKSSFGGAFVDKEPTDKTKPTVFRLFCGNVERGF